MVSNRSSATIRDSSDEYRRFADITRLMREHTRGTAQKICWREMPAGGTRRSGWKQFWEESEQERQLVVWSNASQSYQDPVEPPTVRFSVRFGSDRNLHWC